MNIVPFKHDKDLGDISKETMRLLVIGKTNSGKTYFTKDLLERVGNAYDRVFVISPQAAHFTDMKRRLNCEVTLSPAASTKQYIGAMETIASIRKEQAPHDIIEGVKYYRQKWFVVLDDVIDTKFVNNKICSQSFAMWRHIGVSVAFLIQMPFTYITTIMKMNASHIIMFKGTDPKAIQYYRNVLSGYGPFCDIRNDIQRRNIMETFIRKYITDKKHGALCFNTITDKLTYI